MDLGTSEIYWEKNVWKAASGSSVVTHSSVSLISRDEDPSLPGKISLNCSICSVKCGSKHTIALSKDNSAIFGWGNNLFGQCGHRKKVHVEFPERIPGMSYFAVN
jgi:alpha-tubulin suppressor-like RCC1 family protein